MLLKSVIKTAYFPEKRYPQLQYEKSYILVIFFASIFRFLDQH